MKDESLLRRTLVVMGVLVGAATVWIGLLSIVLVSLTDHVFSRGATTSDATHARAAAEGQVVPASAAVRPVPQARARSTGASARTQTLASRPNG